MGMPEVVLIGLFLLGGVFTVLWWLLREKDRKQGEEIERIGSQIRELYKRANADERELFELRIKIAENHPSKHEIERMIGDVNKRLDQLIEQVSQITTMVKH